MLQNEIKIRVEMWTRYSLLTVLRQKYKHKKTKRKYRKYSDEINNIINELTLIIKKYNDKEKILPNIHNINAHTSSYIRNHGTGTLKYINDEFIKTLKTIFKKSEVQILIELCKKLQRKMKSTMNKIKNKIKTKRTGNQLNNKNDNNKNDNNKNNKNKNNNNKNNNKK